MSSSHPAFQLAQVNVATLRQPIDRPASAAFAEALDEVNALGEAAPGFVWRLQDDAGNATSIHAFDDPLRILNLTVWASVAALRDFAYRGVHRDFFRRRSEWFTDASATALWWIAAGTLPTVADAVHRLAFIDDFGSTPYAFTIGAKVRRLAVLRAPMDDRDARRLIVALNAELLAIDPDPTTHHFGLDPEHVADGCGAFYVAYLDDAAVACGAYRLIDASTAEVKRMYVDPAARGERIGAAVLSSIVHGAGSDGATRLVLETGPLQTAALGLYRRFGFAETARWGEYVDSPTSICLARQL